MVEYDEDGRELELSTKSHYAVKIPPSVARQLLKLAFSKTANQISIVMELKKVAVVATSNQSQTSFLLLNCMLLVAGLYFLITDP